MLKVGVLGFLITSLVKESLELVSDKFSIKTLNLLES